MHCGVDEAGRGPLAGNVFAAAVILNPERPIVGLADSKKLSAAVRERLYLEIITHSLAYSISSSSVAEIDQLNILQATMLAMQRAVNGLQLLPSLVLIDGNKAPELRFPTKTIIQGDVTNAAISAASILAKVSRDREMLELDLRYPGSGFAKHKGYGTKEHLAALAALGPSPEHRRSFAPVKFLS